MIISPLQAAKYICEQSDWNISNLALQKILYLASMVHVGKHGGEPLIRGGFEAWDYGPVHPDVYHRVKAFGSRRIGNVFHDIPDVPQGEERKTLDEACKALLNASPSRLVAITHYPKGAWAKAYEPKRRSRPINQDDMLEEYRNRWPMSNL